MRIFSVFLVSYILGYPSFRLSPVFTVFCHCAIYAILYYVSIMKSKKQLSQIFYQNSYRNFLSKERSLFGKLRFSAFFYITVFATQNFSESVVQRCSIKKVFLKISQNLQENTYARVSFLINLQVWGNFIKKEAQAQVLSCEFCKILKNAFFHRTPPVAVSDFCEMFHMKSALL